jgi:tRNA/tmRNA/rRNA uracil-C5-methylase (TrmA/RlmC/RlmD family)
LDRSMKAFFLSPIASPQEWNYRNRIQVHVENNQFGFIKRNSNTIVLIESCKIAEPALNKALTDLKNTEAVKNTDKIELLIDRNLQVHQRDLNTQGQPVMFSQVNRFANQLLVDSVVEKVIRFQPKTKIYDFYSGDGNFLAAISKKIT